MQNLRPVIDQFLVGNRYRHNISVHALDDGRSCLPIQPRSATIRLSLDFLRTQ